MDALYRQFGFEPEIFRSVLDNTGCFVAGGAVTHVFRGGDPKTFDGDIDIWYPNAPQRDGDSLIKVNAYLFVKEKLMEYLVAHGYTMVNDDYELTKEYTNKENSLSKHILKVLTYSLNKHRIQLIFAFGEPTDILNGFDYSFCAVGVAANGKFFGPELELTREGKGYAMNVARTPERDQMRRKKYTARGFTIVDA